MKSKNIKSNFILKIATTASMIATSSVALSFAEVEAQESLIKDLPIIKDASDANQIRKFVVENYEKLSPQTILILQGLSKNNIEGENKDRIELIFEEVEHSDSPMLQSDN